jgi:hypothetical protein
MDVDLLVVLGIPMKEDELPTLDVTKYAAATSTGENLLEAAWHEGDTHDLFEKFGQNSVLAPHHVGKNGVLDLCGDTGDGYVFGMALFAWDWCGAAPDCQLTLSELRSRTDLLLDHFHSAGMEVKRSDLVIRAVLSYSGT